MRLLPLILLVLITSTLTAQTLFSRINEDVARNMADTLGTFVLIDFYSSQSFNCRLMNERVWRQDTVQTVQDRFVNIRVNIATSNASKITYRINAYPSLVIVDANGKEYFRNIGYMNQSQVLELLNSFPEDMQTIYTVDKVARERPVDFEAQLARGLEYQRKAREAKGLIAGRLASTSTEALETARILLTGETTVAPGLAERLELMMVENVLLQGRSKKALKALAALGNELETTNAALAYYIKGMAYRRQNLPELVEECYEQLKEAEDNEEFLALFQQQE